MKYRRFGKLDWEVSVLGFGVMRLPLVHNNPADIDERESIKMLRHAVDHGVNYLDLGYAHDMIQHERLARIISRALQDGYRKRVRIAASMPLVLIHSPSDFDDHLNRQIHWLQTEGIDFYLLGWLNRDIWPKLKGLGILPWAEKAMTDGRIDHLGFSFHDDYQVLRTILDDYDHWTLCQFQYSYMDMDRLPGVGGMKYAADRGLAVVADEPLRGGRLAHKPPEPVVKVWAETGSRDRSPAEWGLAWVWNHPEVSVVVSDMTSIAQVEHHIGFADYAEPDSFSVQEAVLINRVRQAYNGLKPVPCTACRACMPCPVGIDVPRIFEIYNDAVMYDDARTARAVYHREGHDLDVCTECEICQNACAKGLDIMNYLKKAEQLLVGND